MLQIRRRVLAGSAVREAAVEAAQGRGAEPAVVGVDVFQAPQPEGEVDAFEAHPKIGSPAAAGHGKARAWSREEQRGAGSASESTLARLAAANRDYEARFGHIFIVCASGRTAGEMLALLEERLGNDPAEEISLAAEEQRKITRLRLEKLLVSVAGEATES